MGKLARERVLTHFTWPQKAQQTLEVYRWVRGEGPTPDFGMPFRDLAPDTTKAPTTKAPATEREKRLAARWSLRSPPPWARG